MSDVPGPDDAFGAALYRLLAVDDGNLVFSPASIGAALRMALCGARGQTAAEIAAALGLPGPQAAAGGLRVLAAALGLPGPQAAADGLRRAVGRARRPAGR